MLEVKARKDLGFSRDKFAGWIVYKDQEPVVQVHLYENFYTIFWRGRCSEQQLWNCFERAARELGSLKLEHDFNRGFATYGGHFGKQRTPFVLNALSDEERTIDETQKRLVSALRDQIRFARFDAESQLPLIVWGDILSDPKSELGLSSDRMVPNSAMELLKDTNPHVAEDDIKELKSITEQLIERR